jgi:hypothetical protein
MILAVVASVALLVVSTPSPVPFAGTGPALSRSEPFDTQIPPPVIDGGVSSPRSMTQPREQKPQALPSHWVGPHRAGSVKADRGDIGWRWYPASGPRSPRAPPLSA